jgi:hypothetical protein
MRHVSVQAAEAIIKEHRQGVLQQCLGFLGKCRYLDRELFSTLDFKHRQPDPGWWEKLILMLEAAETLEETQSPSFPIHFLMRRVTNQPEFFTLIVK